MVDSRVAKVAISPGVPARSSGRALDPRQPLVERGDQVRIQARRLQRDVEAQGCGGGRSQGTDATPEARTVPQSAEPAARRDCGGRPNPLRRSCSTNAAGGSIAGADSASRFEPQLPVFDGIRRGLGSSAISRSHALAGGAAQRAEGIVGGELIAQLGVNVVHLPHTF